MTKLDPRIHAYRPDLADVSLQSFVTAPRYAKPKLCQSIIGVAPLLAAPDTRAPLVSEIRYGEFIDVFEQRKDGFSWVQNRIDRSVGYMQTNGAFQETIAAQINKVSTRHTYIYTDPNIKSGIIDSLTMGSFVALSGDEKDFYPLATGGYAFKKHIAPIDEVNTIDYAYTAGLLLGTPYLSGGRTPLGIDTEGLIQFSLEMAGFETPRFYDQLKEMFSQPLPCHWRDVLWSRGDLVFFENPKHMGIMTSHDHMIHACPHAMQVVVEPLTDVMKLGYQIIAAGSAQQTQGN